MLTTGRDLGLPEGMAEEQSSTLMDVSHLHPLPICPFAARGLGSASLQACPGYAPQTISFAGLGAGESLGDRETCTHLGTQRGSRGYVTACLHPGGRPVDVDDRAGRVGRVPRRAAG
jgi:hypothetical protein